MTADFENEQNAAAADDVISDVEEAVLNKNSEKGVSYIKCTNEMQRRKERKRIQSGKL